MTMQDLAGRADLSWMRELRPDPEAAQHKPNKTSRQVRSGHWVPVRPTALPKPKLVIHSPEMAKELGISEEACQSQEFLRFFSGDIDAVPGFDSWATPYALSIMGQPRFDNCPFKTGNGYGDGRAVSIGEVLGPSGQRWEMQLKGGGQTPFCRRADGRAVLRSSVREFLASEAMHHLGISTTRAISLIVSQEETTQRPWYSGRAESGMPGLDDPRIAQAPPELRRMLLQMLAERQGEPDVMIEEQCAITCRVAPSFMRIGHLDLFARRASRADATPEQREELEMIVRHAMNREFADVLPSSQLAERVIAVFEASTERIAAMVAGWLRVGFCQGNFNCDNCLVGGRQMDYGPFGFIDKYDPQFAKWVGSGEHFAFMNQPTAALANLGTLTTALSPLLDAAGKKTLQQKLSEAKGTVQAAVDAVWRSKLGFEAGTTGSRELFATLEPLMQESGVDFTIMFRQMGTLPGRQGAGADEPQLLEPLQDAFYEPPPAPLREKWASWLRKWLAKLASEHAADASLDGARERMRLANPKYILGEHMLVEAYSRAKTGDFSVVHELFRLIKSPYDEQPDLEAKYYRRAPDAALATSGTSVMT